MEIIYVMMIILFAQVTRSQPQHETATGAFFLNKGIVTVTQSSWGLLLEMDTDGIDQCLEQLKREIDELSSHAWPLAMTNLEEKFLTGLNRFIDVSADNYRERTLDLQKQSMDIKSLLLGKTRTRRYVYDDAFIYRKPEPNQMPKTDTYDPRDHLSKRPADLVKHLMGLAAYQDVLMIQSKIDAIHQDEEVFADAWQKTMNTLNQTHLLANLNQLLLRNLTTISHKLRSIVNSAHRDRSRLYHLQRPRRSIAPGLGHLLKSLAGTATMDDIEEVKTRLGLLHKSQEKIQHIVEQSVTLINITHFQAQANSQNIAQLQKETEALRSVIYNLSIRFEEFQQLSSGEILVVIEIMSMMNKVSSTVHTVTNSINTVMESLSSLINGQLSPVLVPPHELIDILEGIDQQLPVGLSLPANPRKNILFYYEASRVLILPATHGYSILIIIPLRPESEQFTIYQVIPIPIQLPNSNSYVYLNLNVNYFAVSSDRTRFFYPQERNILNCLDNRLDICQVKAPLYAMSDKTCLPALFNHDISKATTVCERRVKIYDEPTTIITYIENGNWLLQPFNQQRLIVTCPTSSGQNMDSKVMRLDKSQIITLDRGCSAHGDTFYLPQYYHQTTKLVPKILLNNIANNVDQTEFFKDLMALGNVTSLSNASLIPDFVKPKFLPDMGNVDVSISDLKTAIKQNKQLLTDYDDYDPRFDSTSYSHLGFVRRNWLLITVIIITVVALIFVFYIRKRRRSGDTWWPFWKNSPPPVVLPTRAVEPTNFQSHEQIPLQSARQESFHFVPSKYPVLDSNDEKEATV